MSAAERAARDADLRDHLAHHLAAAGHHLAAAVVAGGVTFSVGTADPPADLTEDQAAAALELGEAVVVRQPRQ